MTNLSYIAVLPFLVSLAVSLVVTPLVVWIFNRLGFVIDPKKNPHPAHIHKEPVPKGGGIPIYFSILVTSLLFLDFDRHILAILSAGIITLVVGVVDDIKGANPYFRLLMNFVGAGIIVASGIGISFVTNPAGGIIDISSWYIADLFALIWIPSLMNAINWSSGVDGQISGVVTLAALFLGVVSTFYSADITQWPVSILAFAMAGGFAGLTIYHFYPQKIMPGYSATSLAGLMLGVLSILATGKVGTALMVLAVPLIDFVYLIFRRLTTGKSPVWGDKEHLHHKLLKMGWGKRRVALFYWGITLILGLFAINFQARIKIIIMIALVLLMAFFWIWQYYGRFSKR